MAHIPYDPRKPQTYAYRVNDGDWWHFTSDWQPAGNIKYIAHEAAQDYHDNHDGYEDSWPLTLTIAVRCHAYVFEVYREFSPDFEPVPVKRNSKCSDDLEDMFGVVAEIKCAQQQGDK